MPTGVYIRTEEMRLKRFGRKFSEKAKENMRKAKLGKPSPMKDKHHTQETKDKIRKSTLNKIISEETKEKLRQANLGKKESEETKEKKRQKASGRKHSPEHVKNCVLGHLHLFSSLDRLLSKSYCILFNNSLKEAIRIRDNFTCQLCGIKQSELTGHFKQLSIHHIHYDKQNCYPDLITLCNTCNIKANFNRNKWESYYMNKLNDRQLLFWTKRRKEINTPK